MGFRDTVSAKVLGAVSVLDVWRVVRRMPNGGRLMGSFLGRMAPYSGTIRAEVLQLTAGEAFIRMKDRASLRNHLNSIHAIALMNLAEMTSGVAVLSAIPRHARAIPSHLEMDYLKKARGPIVAECRFQDAVFDENLRHEVHVTLRNESGTTVATAMARWKISL